MDRRPGLLGEHASKSLRAVAHRTGAGRKERTRVRPLRGRLRRPPGLDIRNASECAFSPRLRHRPSTGRSVRGRCGAKRPRAPPGTCAPRARGPAGRPADVAIRRKTRKSAERPCAQAMSAGMRGGMQSPDAGRRAPARRRAESPEAEDGGRRPCARGRRKGVSAKPSAAGPSRAGVHQSHPGGRFVFVRGGGDHEPFFWGFFSEVGAGGGGGGTLPRDAAAAKAAGRREGPGGRRRRASGRPAGAGPSRT